MGKGLLLVSGMVLFINPFSWQIIFSSFYVLLWKIESLSFCGVLIGEVIPGSPAEYVGMTPGQVIVEADKNPISDVVKFREVLLRKRPSDSIEVRTLDGQSFNLTLEESTIYSGQPFMGIANLTNFRCFPSV